MGYIWLHLVVIQIKKRFKKKGQNILEEYIHRAFCNSILIKLSIHILNSEMYLHIKINLLDSKDNSN